MSLNGIKDMFNKNSKGNSPAETFDVTSEQLEKDMWGRSLVEAAYEGDMAQLRKALDNGADIDFQPSDDARFFANWLHIDGPYYQHGGLKNDAALVEFCKGNPDPRYHRCGSGNTALMRAVFFNHEDAVRLLLEKGAKIGIQNSVGQDALAIARMTENAKMQEILIEELGRRGTTPSGPLKILRPLKFKRKPDDPDTP